MTSFEKIDRLNVEFDKHGISNVNMSGGTYSGNIYITTQDDKVVELKFKDISDLKTFAEMMLTLAFKIEWDANYPGAYLDNTDGRWSVDDVREWKRVHDEPLNQVPSVDSEG